MNVSCGKSRSHRSELIVGGAINEKERFYGKAKNNRTKANEIGKTNFDPQQNSAHLLHAIVGLDRYPSYLSRWNYDNGDIDRLEAALEEQLDKVRKQKQQLSEQNSSISSILQNNYKNVKSNNRCIFDVPSTWDEVREKILHPSASKAIFGSKFFQSKSHYIPTVQDVLSGKVNVQLDLHMLTEWMEEEYFDVYSFPLLSKEFCQNLKKAMKEMISSCSEELNLHDMGRKPTDIDSIGISWLNNLLFHLIIRPLSSELFGTTEGFKDLDWRQGYLARYSYNPSSENGAQRQRLVPHTDDSEVTLNIGMGDENFEGGDLAFWNLRGSSQEGKFVGQIHPRMGYALLHSGRHLHEVQEVTKGDRFAYIIWARSWGNTRGEVCPCCWLTRRQNTNQSKHQCICAPKWN